MFNRSEESNLRYTEYVGDGDSAVEVALVNEVTYGAVITKIDCINHKSKVSNLFIVLALIHIQNILMISENLTAKSYGIHVITLNSA